MEQKLRIAVYGDSLMKGTLRTSSSGIIFTPICLRLRLPV